MCWRARSRRVLISVRNGLSVMMTSLLNLKWFENRILSLRRDESKRRRDHWLPFDALIVFLILALMSRPNLRWEHVLYAVMIATLLIAVAAFMNLGRFNRYMADDYCLSADLQKSGFVQAQ